MTKEEELIEATKVGNLQKIKDLVNQGIDIHTQNNEALYRAVNHNYLNIVKYLVGQDADIHAQNDFALRLAAGKGYLDIVKYLVKQGADIYAENNLALFWAKRNNYQDVVEYLEGYKKIQFKSKKIFNLKDLNTDGRITCAKCGGRLNMSIGLGNQYNYCSVCEG